MLFAFLHGQHGQLNLRSSTVVQSPTRAMAPPRARGALPHDLATLHHGALGHEGSLRRVTVCRGSVASLWTDAGMTASTGAL